MPSHTHLSDGLHHLRHRRDEMLTLRLLDGELFAAGSRQLIKARPTIVLGYAPFTLEPTALLDAVEGRIESTLLDAQHIFRQLLYTLPHAIAVHRPQGQCLEDE